MVSLLEAADKIVEYVRRSVPSSGNVQATVRVGEGGVRLTESHDCGKKPSEIIVIRDEPRLNGRLGSHAVDRLVGGFSNEGGSKNTHVSVGIPKRGDLVSINVDVSHGSNVVEAHSNNVVGMVGGGLRTSRSVILADSDAVVILDVREGAKLSIVQYLPEDSRNNWITLPDGTQVLDEE